MAAQLSLAARALLATMAVSCLGLTASQEAESFSSTSPEPVTIQSTTTATTPGPGFCGGCPTNDSPCKADLPDGSVLCLGYIDVAATICPSGLTRCADAIDLVQCGTCDHGVGPCKNDVSGLCLDFVPGTRDCPPTFRTCENETTQPPMVINTACSSHICQHGTAGNCYQPDTGICLPYKYASGECYPNTQACGGGTPCQQCNFQTDGPCKHPSTGFCSGFVPGTVECQAPLTTCSVTDMPTPSPSPPPTDMPTVALTECADCTEGSGTCKAVFGPETVICYPHNADRSCPPATSPC